LQRTLVEREQLIAITILPRRMRDFGSVQPRQCRGIVATPVRGYGMCGNRNSTLRVHRVDHGRRSLVGVHGALDAKCNHVKVSGGNLLPSNDDG
jgi:hypothetical protein